MSKNLNLIFAINAVVLLSLAFLGYTRIRALEYQLQVTWAVQTELTRQRDVCDTERSDVVEELYWLKKEKSWTHAQSGNASIR